MTMNDGERELRDFVLRKLADEDRERLEEALFADDDMFERLVEAEYELIDEWGRGSLQPEQRREVESVIGSTPIGAERLRMAKTMTALASRSSVVPIESFRRRSATWLPIAAAAGVALVVAGLWFANSQSASPTSPRSQVAQSDPEGTADAPGAATSGSSTAVAPIAQTESVAPVLQPDPAATPSRKRNVTVPREPLALALSLATLRSDAVEPVLAVGDQRPVEISVALDPADRFDRYAISISDPAGNVVHSDSSVRAIESSGALRVATTIPSEKLAEGLHEISVQADGIDLGWVTFRIEKN